MSFADSIYKAIFKRSSIFALTMVGGAFLVETFINEASDTVFETYNRGRLWHHIKDNYTPKE